MKFDKLSPEELEKAASMLKAIAHPMRIAILNRDRCQPKRCNTVCVKYCPRVRSGDETVIIGEKGKPIISEELCVGCGICVHKCPFGAIQIINLAEELESELVHQYGVNGFRLYRLPIPRAGEVVGIGDCGGGRIRDPVSGHDPHDVLLGAGFGPFVGGGGRPGAGRRR